MKKYLKNEQEVLDALKQGHTIFADYWVDENLIMVEDDEKKELAFHALDVEMEEERVKALVEEPHKILTKEETLKALRNGYKLTSKEWGEDEFIFMRGGIFDELDRRYSDRELNQILEDFELYIKC